LHNKLEPGCRHLAEELASGSGPKAGSNNTMDRAFTGSIFDASVALAHCPCLSKVTVLQANDSLFIGA
jgi:hypothetical protein